MWQPFGKLRWLPSKVLPVEQAGLHAAWELSSRIGVRVISLSSGALPAALRGCCRRDGQGEPHVPALGAVLGGEFLVAFEVEIALITLAERNDVADLGPDAED